MVEAFEYITTVDLNLGSRYSPIKMASLTLHDEVKHKWLFNCHVGLPSWACLTKQEQHHPRGRAGRASSIAGNAASKGMVTIKMACRVPHGNSVRFDML